MKNDLYGGEFPGFFFHLLFSGLDLKIAQSQKCTVKVDKKSSKAFQPEDKEGGPVGWKMLRGMLFFSFCSSALYLRQALVKKRYSYSGGSRESTHNSKRKTSLTRRTENRYLYDAESITVSTRNGLSYRKCMNSTGGQNPGFLVSVPKKEALGNHKVWEKSWRRGKWRDTLNLCMTL